MVSVGHGDKFDGEIQEANRSNFTNCQNHFEFGKEDDGDSVETTSITQW